MIDNGYLTEIETKNLKTKYDEEGQDHDALTAIYARELYLKTKYDEERQNHDALTIIYARELCLKTKYDE